MHVRTLGGEERELDGMIYDYQIKDLMARVHHFKAYGLDRDAEGLGDVPRQEALQKLFPQVQGAGRLASLQEVDYLIGLRKASWHPDKREKAGFGCDFWIWGNNFRSCLGGSHPLIRSYHQRSSSLNTVLKTTVTKDACVNRKLLEENSSGDKMALGNGAREEVWSEMEVEQCNMGYCGVCGEFHKKIVEEVDARPLFCSVERNAEGAKDKAKNVRKGKRKLKAKLKSERSKPCELKTEGRTSEDRDRIVKARNDTREKF